MSELIYGRHPVLEALRAGEPILELHVAEGAKPRGALASIMQLARQSQIPVKWVPRKALDREVASHARRSANHQGVVALTSGFEYSDVAQILAGALRERQAPFLLVLDEIQDVYNLGNLIRTAVAVGVHGLLISDRSAAAITPAVRKSSAGAAAHLLVARCDLPPSLDDLRERAMRIVGLDASGEVEHTRADLTGPLVLVVGGEARGLRPSVSRRCDLVVRLPMTDAIDSLNAGVAGSVVLYEALRQRRG